MVKQVIHPLLIWLVRGFLHGLLNIQPPAIGLIRPNWAHLQHNILVLRIGLALLRAGI